MGYLIRGFFIITSFIFAGTFLLQAEENKASLLKTHKHRKAKFSLSYPSDWSEKADADGIAFNLGGELLQGGGQLEVAMFAREVSAVTGACLLISKERYLDIGGLDEVTFPTSYNDVDLCLRLSQRGWTCILEPEAHLLHHESASRKNDEREVGFRKAMKDRWGPLLGNEKFRHPLLSNAQDRSQGLKYHWYK